MKSRLHVEPLPANANELLIFVRRALSLTKIQRISITPKGVEVERIVEEGEPIVPLGTNDVDMAYMLDHINLTPYGGPVDEHPVYSMYNSARMLEANNRDLYAIVAPGWPLFAAWLGVEATPTPPKTLFGFAAIFVAPTVTNSRIILLGAPPVPVFLTDCDYGVVIDMGV